MGNVDPAITIAVNTAVVNASATVAAKVVAKDVKTILVATNVFVRIS